MFMQPFRREGVPWPGAVELAKATFPLLWWRGGGHMGRVTWHCLFWV